jgi:hypothetical protein
MGRWAWQIAVRAAVLGAAVLAAVLGGTGGHAASAQPTPQPAHSNSPTPAPVDAGTKLQGAGFVTTLPPGWANRTTLANRESGTSYAAVLLDVASVGSTVISIVPYAPDKGRVMRAVVTEQGGYDASGPRPYVLAGARGVTETFKKKHDDMLQDNRLIIVTHGARSYVIAFSVPSFTVRIGSEALDELLSGWHWTS